MSLYPPGQIALEFPGIILLLHRSGRNIYVGHPVLLLCEFWESKLIALQTGTSPIQALGISLEFEKSTNIQTTAFSLDLWAVL